ncbi:protein UsfY [Mycobacterium sp. IDR2000157661]|uniref:protein UsfY n=1 Tax=Mycobacterium sp. IDR2000157661 TaxID=2867005 RepID=UPI001EED6C55|nr:protein UsfY [Mycobacterium sp. IDR2000157661]ULE34905.1 UsfY protein [Mycobacterium sp. IDR2000157661]
MGLTHHDPTDHHRTTQPHAGITMKDNFYWPGLILLALSAAAIVATIAVAAYGRYDWLLSTALVAVLGAVAGAMWIVVENRRVLRLEKRWESEKRKPAG